MMKMSIKYRRTFYIQNFIRYHWEVLIFENLDHMCNVLAAPLRTLKMLCAERALEKVSITISDEIHFHGQQAIYKESTTYPFDRSYQTYGIRDLMLLVLTMVQKILSLN